MKPSDPWSIKSDQVQKLRQVESLPGLETASHILYAEIPRTKIALYRFLLEGYDNLAIMSVIDRYRAVVRLRFLPVAEQTLRQLMTSQGAKIIAPFLCNTSPNP